MFILKKYINYNDGALHTTTAGSAIPLSGSCIQPCKIYIIACEILYDVNKRVFRASSPSISATLSTGIHNIAKIPAI